jgi:hypothetical protein
LGAPDGAGRVSAPNINDALAHIDAALHELTTEAWSCAVQADASDDSNWKRLPQIQATIAEDLDRIDEAIGRPPNSIFAAIGTSIRQAVIEIVAAKQSLGVRQ